MPSRHEFLPIPSIVIAGDRQRKEFDPAAEVELARSIEDFGLFHALQVREGEPILVTGERRLRAIRDHIAPLNKSYTYGGEQVPPGHIPVIRVTTTDPIELEAIELDENWKRKDLTWQEHAAATARLHSLRGKQAEKAAAEVIADPQASVLDKLAASAVASGFTVPQTVAATALEIHGRSDGDYQERTRKEILLAAHLDKPEVAKAPTLKDAFKALKKIEEQERNRVLAAAVGETFHSGLHRVLQGNCIEQMGHMLDNEEERYDVILTDPPYGMGAHTFGDAAGRLVEIDHQYDDSYESWQALMKEWCPLSYQIAAPQAHAYVFCDIDRFHELKGMMQEAGWYVFRTPFTNYKRNSGRVPLPDKGPRRQSEWLLYAIKGDKLVNYIASDVIESGSDENLTHGAQKPVGLYVDLLKRSIKPGDRVLDTFGGTGTLIPAAHQLKCIATVVEQNPTYYGLCVQRLQDLDKQGELV